MAVVVDASVTLQACLAESGFDHFGDEELHAPRLMWSEATSSLHELAWRGTVTTRLAHAALDRLASAPMVTHTGVDLSKEAWRVAEELGWAKTYDAEYVALARRLDCRLVTVDARLRRGASRLVEAVGPAEL